MTTSNLGSQSIESVQSGDPESRLGAQSAEIITTDPSVVESKVGSQSAEIVTSLAVQSRIGSQSIEVVVPSALPPGPPDCKLEYHFKASDIDGAGTAAVAGTTYTSIYNHATGETYTTTDTTSEYTLVPFKLNGYGNLVTSPSGGVIFHSTFPQFHSSYQDVSFRIKANGVMPGVTEPHSSEYAWMLMEFDPLVVFSVYATVDIMHDYGKYRYSITMEEPDNATGAYIEESGLFYPFGYIDAGFKNAGHIIYIDVDGEVTEATIANPGIPTDTGTATHFYFEEGYEIIVGCTGTLPPPPVPPNPLLDFIVPPDRSVYLDLVSKDNPLAGWMPGRYKVENDAGILQVVKNYYGQRMEVPLKYPPGTTAGYTLLDGC